MSIAQADWQIRSYREGSKENAEEEDQEKRGWITSGNGQAGRRQNYIDFRMTARRGGKLFTVHLRRRPYDRCGQRKGEGEDE